MFLIASYLLISANPSELRSLDNYQINGVRYTGNGEPGTGLSAPVVELMLKPEISPEP